MKKTRKQWMTNRDMARSPHKTRFICGRCDIGQILNPGLRCNVCGHREGRKRNKK